MTETLQMTRQTREEFTIEYRDGNSPVDLTGYSAKMQLRDKITNAVALTLWSSALSGSRLVIDAPNGKVTAVFATADTADIPLATYRYDVALLLDGEVTRPVAGEIRFDDCVTEVL